MDDDARHLQALVNLLGGLVPLHMLRLSDPGRRMRVAYEAGNLAAYIAAAGDHLTNPAKYRRPDDRQARARVLSAMAAGLALGAYQPGGITWGGSHWCTAPHPECPNGRTIPPVGNAPSVDVLPDVSMWQPSGD